MNFHLLIHGTLSHRLPARSGCSIIVMVFRLWKAQSAPSPTAGLILLPCFHSIIQLESSIRKRSESLRSSSVWAPQHLSQFSPLVQVKPSLAVLIVQRAGKNKRRSTNMVYTHPHDQSKRFNQKTAPIVAHDTELASVFFPYRSLEREPLGEIAQPTPRLPVPMSFQSPPPASSYYTPSETGSVLEFSIPGFNTEGMADRNTAYDYPRRGRDGCCCGWGFSAHARGHNSHLPAYPLGLTISSSPFVQPGDDTLGEPFPGFRTYGTIYTDNSTMKPGEGIRRQCSNCRTTDTATWRRSTLNPEKLVCNKCGLYERTHGVSRPKEFPRRRRSRPASVHPSVNPPIGGEDLSHFIGFPSNVPFASHPPDAFGTVGGATFPQGTSWVTHDMPHVSPTSSHTSTCYSTELPRIYHTDSSPYLL